MAIYAQEPYVPTTMPAMSILKVVESIPDLSFHGTLEKKNRPAHAPIHSLIDKILPIAAGSENIHSQKKVFENRWEFMHKQSYVPTTMTVSSILQLIKAKFERKDELMDFYLSQARKINIKVYLSKVLDDIPVPPDYSSLDKKERRSFSHCHSLIDKCLPFSAGSPSPDVQLKLLTRRWKFMHKKEFKQSSWKTLKDDIKALPKPKNWLDLSNAQKIHSQHTQKLGSLSALIRKISQSERVEDHIEIMCESLQRMHSSKPKAENFLSAAHLKLFFEYLIPIPKFVKPSPKYDEQYKAVIELVEKLVGDDEPEIVSRFLRSQFLCLRERVT